MTGRLAADEVRAVEVELVGPVAFDNSEEFVVLIKDAGAVGDVAYGDIA